MTADSSGSRPGLPGDTLEEVVTRYLNELADGRRPDPEVYCRAHPVLADALRGVFATLNLVEAAGQSLSACRLEAGQQVGDFRIIREVGRGGMGVVYEAVQVSLGRRVALKVLPAHTLLSGSALERFQREAQTAGRLHHTNIVPVYAVGEESGVHYYAMQFIEGRSLAHVLRAARAQRPALDRAHFRRVAHWGQQAAEALAAAHGHGVIHRDVKPANLLVDAEDCVWVSDFGLARASIDPTLTRPDDLLGTLSYMSPEQARGDRAAVTPRSDVYALGATLYELASLCPAFGGDSRAQVLHAVLHVEPRPLQAVVPSAPRDLETIIAKCMQKEPALRYASAADLAEDLRRFLADEPIRARPTPWHVKVRRWVRRHRAVTTGAVAAVVLALCAVVLAVYLRRAEGARCLRDAYVAIMFEQDQRRGEELLDRAAASGAASTELSLFRGLIPLLNQQPQRAIPYIEEVLRQQPHDLNALYALARAHIDMGDLHTGQRLFEREGPRRPDTALGWFLRGYARSQHEPGEAIACYDRALELQADFVPAILERALYRSVRLLEEGRRDDLDPMLNDVDAVVVFRPNSAVAYAWRAWARLAAAAYATTQPDLRFEREAWLAKSRADLEAATARQPEGDPVVCAVRGAYWRYVGDFVRSADACAEGMRLNEARWGSPNAVLVHVRAVALHALGDVPTALEETEPVCQTAPGFYILALHRAILLAEAGRLDEARALARESLRLQRSHASGLFLSAAVLEFLGEGAAARAEIAALDEGELAGLTHEHPTRALDTAVLDYLAGRNDAEALLAAAGDHAGRRCEYVFLIGLRELGAGHRASGLAALQQCAETQVFIYGEHRLAVALLTRAAADERWPGWVPRTAQ